MNKREAFDLDLVRDINRLWLPVYSGLARQVSEICEREPHQILELGCFSGGTGLELLKIFPRAKLTIALDMPELISSFQTEWGCPDESRVILQEVSLNNLSMLGKKYDLVFCRGAFFFLEPNAEIVKEMFGVLAAGGTAFWGGGYGAYTSEEVILKIADESRIKNNTLGRKIYSIEEIQEFLKRSGTADESEIIKVGGLWVLMNRQGLING